MTMARIPFLALRPGPDREAIREAMERVVERGWFVLGPELEAFEREFAAASGATTSTSWPSATTWPATDALASMRTSAPRLPESRTSRSSRSPGTTWRRNFT